MIQMRNRCKKYPTWYVRFPMGKHQSTIKEVTKDIADYYVSTFIFLQMFLYLETSRYIYKTFYVKFSTILDFYFCKLLLIKGRQIADIKCYTILIFQNITTHWFESLGGERNSQYSMLYFSGK